MGNRMVSGGKPFREVTLELSSEGVNCAMAWRTQNSKWKGQYLRQRDQHCGQKEQGQSTLSRGELGVGIAETSPVPLTGATHHPGPLGPCPLSCTLGHSFLLSFQICLSKTPTAPVPYLSATHSATRVTASIPTWSQIQAGLTFPLSQSPHFFCLLPSQHMATPQALAHLSLLRFPTSVLLYLTGSPSSPLEPHPSPWALEHHPS